MPKAILEFNLPEDRAEHSTALAASDLVCVIERVRSIMVTLSKYGGQDSDQKEHDFTSVHADYVLQQLNRIIEEEGVENILL